MRNIFVQILDIYTVPFHPKNGQPISQWSGQINGFDMSHVNNKVPAGNGMNSGGGNGNGNNGSGSSGSGSNGSESSGSGSNGSGNNGSGNNGSGYNESANNGMGNWQWNNGSSSNGGNGWSWSNSTSSGFQTLQNQGDEYPGSGYPSMYYQQYSQSFVMPTPANAQDIQNARPPNVNNFANQGNNNGGNMGNGNYPSGYQYCTCVPVQSAGSENIPTKNPVTPVSTAAGITDVSEESATLPSTRKRSNKQ